MFIHGNDMTQINSGAYRFLALPAYYNVVQKTLGGNAARDKVVKRYIKPSAGMSILDIGCGTAEILEHLPIGAHYVGFDASAEYIAHARQRYGTRGRFYQSLATSETLDSPGSYDLVLASGVLHHLNDEEVAILAATAKLALRLNGKLITLDCAYTPNQNPVARFLISRDRGQNVRSPEGYARFFSQDKGWNTKVHLCHDLLRVPYTHVVLESQLVT